MYWYVDIEQTRLLGFTVPEWGLSKDSRAFELRYLEGDIVSSIVELGDLIHSTDFSLARCFGNAGHAVEKLVKVLGKEEKGIADYFNEYVEQNSRSIWTVENANYIVEHLCLDSACNVEKSLLKIGENKSIVSTPFWSPMLKFRLPDVYYKTKDKAIMALIGKITEDCLMVWTEAMEG